MTNDQEPAEAAAQDIRPVVASPPGNRAVWVFGAGLLAASLLLFQALEARRAAVTAPSTAAPASVGAGQVSSPPELTIPDNGAATPPAWQIWPQPVIVRPPSAPVAVQSQPVVAPTVRRGAGASFPTPSPSLEVPATTPAWSGRSGGASGSSAAAPTWTSPAGSELPPLSGKDATADKDRVKAAQFSNPATTIPKGTVIQAVLESALDSTRSGFARAIVARDVWSFDGSRVLIQRGSRLTGEYKSDVASGQSRVLIQWQRLMRPDGVMIELDSPSADPLGRAGVKGSVNTHFFERFGGAILQSALQIGVQLASRAATRDAYILALPGSLPAVTNFTPDKIAPTVKVRQGTSVSVFAAKDLDFTGF